MLQTMREKMQGIIAGIIVGLIAVTFALWGVQYYLRGTKDTEILAKVAGDNITEQQVKRVYTDLQRQILATQQDVSSLDQKQQNALKQHVLQEMISNKVMLNLAKNLDLYIGFAQIQAGIKQMPVLQSSSGGFSLTKFQQLLSNLGYNEAMFAKEMQDNFMLNQMDIGFVNSTILMPYEKRVASNLLLQQRDFSYIVLEANKFVDQVSVNDDEAKDFYTKNQNNYVLPEKVSLEYIELNNDVVAQNIAQNINDAKLQKFYQEHKDLFVKNTEDKIVDFAKVKDNVKTEYIHQMTQQQLAEYNEQMAELTYTNSDSLEKASKELGLKIQSTELFTSNYKADLTKTNNDNILNNSKVIKNAFSETVLRQGYNSNVLELSDNRFIVIRIKQHIPESVLPFEQVKQDIVNILKLDKAHDLAMSQANKIVNLLQTGVTLDKIKQDYSLQVKELKNIERNTKDIDPSILQLGFRLPQPKYITNNANKYSIGIASIKNNNVAIVKVEQVNDNLTYNAKDVSDNKDFNTLMNSLQLNIGQYEYQSLVNAFAQKTKIQIMALDKETENV